MGGRLTRNLSVQMLDFFFQKPKKSYNLTLHMSCMAGSPVAGYVFNTQYPFTSLKRISFCPIREKMCFSFFFILKFVLLFLNEFLLVSKYF